MRTPCLLMAVQAVDPSTPSRSPMRAADQASSCNYFILTGLDAFHLVIGLGVLAVLSQKPEMTKNQFAF